MSVQLTLYEGLQSGLFSANLISFTRSTCLPALASSRPYITSSVPARHGDALPNGKIRALWSTSVHQWSLRKTYPGSTIRITTANWECLKTSDHISRLPAISLLS